MKYIKRIAGSIALIVLSYFIFAVFFPEKIYNTAITLQQRSAGLIEKELNVGNEKIVYLESGTGPDVLILLHGFAVDKNTWNAIAKHLSKYRLIIPDLPGFGKSTRDNNLSYDLFSQSERLERFLSGLELKKFFIAGNSMGGNIAGIYSIKYPDKVRGCILLNNSGVVTPEKSEMTKLFEAGENPLIINNMDDHKRMMKFIFVKEPFALYPLKKVMFENSIKNKSFNEKIFKDFVSKPAMIDQNFAALTMPVLVIWGDSDKLIDVSAVSVMEKNIKNVKSHILKNCGHVPMVERPEETAEYIRAFIESNR